MKTAWLLFLLAGLGALALDVSGQSGAVQHKGDLVIGWGKVVTIENTTHQQEGDIYVEDGGTLIVRNATLRMQMDYEGQYALYVRGEGKLELTNTRMTGPSGYRKDVVISDRAQATLSAVSGDGVHPWLYGEGSLSIRDSTIALVHMEDGTNLEARRSRIQAFIRIRLEARGPVTFRGLVPGQHTSFSIPGPSVSGVVPFRLTLEDCDLGGWVLNIAEPGLDVTIQDSELFHAQIGLHGVSGTVRGLLAGLQSAWDSQSLGLRGLPYRLRLVNTTLTDGWFLNLSNDRPMELADCALSALSVGGETDLRLVNSTVRWLGVSGLQGRIDCAGSAFTDYLQVVDSQVHWAGDARFRTSRFGGGWHDSTIRRTYAVRVVDEAGQPVAGARVRVKDAWGSPSRDYTADKAGQVEIELKFTDETCRSTWTVSLPGCATEQAVTFFSASPVLLVRRTE